MLKLRIATALVLAPAVLAGVVFLAHELFALFIALLAAFGLYEWAGLAGFARPRARIVYLLLAGACMGAFWFRPEWWTPMLVATSVFWLLACVFVLQRARGGGDAAVQTSAASPRQAFPSGADLPRRVWFCVGGLLAFAGAWLGLVSLHAIDAWLIVWAFAVAWSVDTGAYFTGRAWGRNKLAPRVSPGKTWEGAAGGIGAGLAVGCGLAWTLDLGPLSEWAMVAGTLSVVAVFGDLFESAVKRASGTKDSGSLLPGHGGVLDRIDSTLAVAPIFALWALVMM